MNLKIAITVAVLSVGLTACNDSDDEPMPPPVTPTASDDVPASAKASSQAYVSFAASLPRSDTAKPLDISQTTAPTSETAAPAPL